MRHILSLLLNTQTIDITKSFVIIIIVAEEKFRTENNKKNKKIDREK